ncbi:MAG: hypothetical protein R3D85_01075 [Paracoccaceae bacterium]
MTRDEISALLPFLANGTLEGDEKAQVEAALAEDTVLRDELRALRAIRATMQDEAEFTPGEMGLARLMRGVEAETAVAAAPRRTWIWQAAAAVLLAVAVGQAALTWRAPAPGGYELAGAGEAALSVAVAPGVSEEAFRALLLDAGVAIVGGPSALGLYDLAPSEGTDLAAARAALEASPLIDSVQSPED